MEETLGSSQEEEPGRFLAWVRASSWLCPTQQSHTLPQGWVAGGQDNGCPWHGCQLYCLPTRVCHNSERTEVESVKRKSKGKGRNNWKWNRKGGKLGTTTKRRHYILKKQKTNKIHVSPMGRDGVSRKVLFTCMAVSASSSVSSSCTDSTSLSKPVTLTLDKLRLTLGVRRQNCFGCDQPEQVFY